MHYAYYRMTRWMTTVDVVYCEPQSPQEDDAVQYSHRVKRSLLVQQDLNKWILMELPSVNY